MCQKAGLLLGWDDSAKRVLVVRANCDQWSCTECADRMAERWGLRATLGCNQIIKSGKRLDFVTITSHEKLPNFIATEAVWQTAWNALYCAIKRVCGDFTYMIVPEKHKSGRMHVHALWNAEVSQRWLKDNARKRGLGYQCKVVPVDHTGHCAKYVIKYIGKDLGADCPPHFRRVRVSHNWADIPQPTTADTNLRWEYVGTNGALQIVYDDCQSRSYTMIDKQTGEYFDDIDLDTILQTS